MSYQVLARKWRPQNFQQMVGQSHVLRALLTALDENRLHHAYLFTGTRGVGKTTIARIFAKSLNCETGITSTPCGECRSCLEIAEGRHVDLIEVDAASRTKVEDTRELLDNVQYAPTRGRFKIYLIDEVHMLSGHSFNALLKTLEEPPPHVKFLLATTDPQKLPVTVLSRCLQFNLKRMPVEMIAIYLAQVLSAETITFEEPALRILARVADGSMRDALSLTDQAIVTGGGAISTVSVQDMLGLLPAEHLANLLQALAADDAPEVLAVIEQMAQLTTDFTTAADSLIALLHQLAVEQLVPTASSESNLLPGLAQVFSAADLQLYYQMALYGRRDLPLNPDPRSGFEMLLLRMLAFRLDDGRAVPRTKKKTVIPEPAPAAPPTSEKVHPPVSPVIPAIIPRVKSAVVSTDNENEDVAPAPAPLEPDVPVSRDNQWHDILPKLGLGGMALQLAEHCVLKSMDALNVVLSLDSEGINLQTRNTEEQLTHALREYLGGSPQVVLEAGHSQVETPGQRRVRLGKERQLQAEQAVEQDPFVRQLKERFGARVIPGSVRPHTDAQK